MMKRSLVSMYYKLRTVIGLEVKRGEWVEFNASLDTIQVISEAERLRGNTIRTVYICLVLLSVRVRTMSAQPKLLSSVRARARDGTQILGRHAVWASNK